MFSWKTVGCSQKLECALFFHWDDEGKLQGIAGTHVDDVLAGLRPDFEDAAFTKVKQRFRFGKWEKDEFIFRGREWKRGPKGEGLITMRSYAMGLTTLKFPKGSRTQLERESLQMRRRLC